MKPKNFALIVLLVAMLGICIWLFTQPTTATPTKIVETPMSAMIVAPKPAAHIAQVELPKLSPVALKSETAEPQPTADAPIATDPQTDLKTAFADMGRLIRAGNMVQFYQTYRMPGKFSPEDAEREKLIEARAKINPNPQNQIIQEEFAEAMEALADQSPTFNTAGDEATYIYTAPTLPGQEVPDSPHPVTFLKYNGKWYIKPGN